MSEPDPIREQRRELGRRLATARKQAGYSQREFASRISYARSTVSTVESGVQQAGPSFWQACDRVLRTGGTFARGYDQLRARQAAVRSDPAHRAHAAGPNLAGLRADELADALAAYQALGWPVTVAGETAELATGTTLDALEVPKTAGRLAACWWRHADGVTDAIRGLPDPRRALAVIACANSFFFLTAPGCCPWDDANLASDPPIGDEPVISWHSADGSVPAPPSANRDGHQATWAYLPDADIELACPVALLDLLAKAIATTREQRALALPGNVRAIPATGDMALPDAARWPT
jgi:DNA-binding XRE family transcriptional regulator